MLLNKFKQKEALLAILIWIIWLIALWLRTGKIPAPVGDEVFFAEQAYWLLEEGRSVRYMHPDILGSNLLEFSPPVIPFFQFISFYLFGLNQFSMGFPASFFVSFLTLVIFLIALKKKWPVSIAIYSAIAFGSIPVVLKYGIRVRYEIFYTLPILLSIYILLFQYRTKYLSLISSYFVGLLIGLSILAYYPFVIAFAVSGFLLIYFSYSKEQIYNSFSGFILGVATVGFFSMLWIYPDFDVFIKQMTSVSGKRFKDFYSIKEYGIWFNIAIVFTALYFLIFYAFKYKLNQAKACLIIVIIISLHYVISKRVEFTSFVLLIIGILLLGNQVFSSIFKKTIHNIFRLMASGSLFLMIFLAFKGFSPERNYKLFSKEILNNTNLNKIVLSDSSAWLALRPVLNKDKLIAMELGVGATEAYVISFLHNTNNTSKVSAAVYMKSREDQYLKIHPLFKELISETYCNKKQIGLGPPLQVVVLNCVN